VKCISDEAHHSKSEAHHPSQDISNGSHCLRTSTVSYYACRMQHLRLKAREERRLLRGHLWVYRNELAELPGLEDGQIVGRIAGILNTKYIKKWGNKYASFSRPDFIDDKEVSKALFETVEDWAKTTTCLFFMRVMDIGMKRGT